MRSKIKKLVLAHLLWTGVSCLALGQESRSVENTLRISLGADHHRIIDQAFTYSKLKFTGTTFMIDLSYQKKTDTYFLRALLQGSFGKVFTGDKALSANVDRINLELSYARHLFDYPLGTLQNECYLGAQVSSFNSALADDPVLENVSVTFYHTLNLLLEQISWIDNKNGLQVKLALPVMGWVKRSAYDGGANQELEENESNIAKLFFEESTFSMLNPFTAARIKIGYMRHLTPKTDFTIGYLFNYLYSSDGEPIRSFNNSLLVGLKFNL